jgi:hypothetical protein
LTQLEFDVFYKNRLGQLPYIKRERLETILQREFGEITINYNQDQLRTLAKKIIKQNILKKKEDPESNKNENYQTDKNTKYIIETNREKSNEITNTTGLLIDIEQDTGCWVDTIDNTLDISQSTLLADNHIPLRDPIDNNLNIFKTTRHTDNPTTSTDNQDPEPFSIELVQNTKMVVNQMIHKPDVFSGKMSEDIDRFIRKFELVAVVNGWNDSDKLVILQLYLTDSAENFLEQLKLKKENITWNEIKEELISEFTTVGNKHLLRSKLENLD